MEQIRKAERDTRSLRLLSQNSEDSLATEEEDTIISHLRDSKLFTNSSSSSSSLELSMEDRNSYYACKYPRLARLEEVCSQIEQESEHSSTIAASESGYDAEESMSITIQTISDLLDHHINDINDSTSKSSSHTGSFQDSLLHESSLTSAQTSYRELKEILVPLSISEQKIEIFSDNGNLVQFQSRLIRTINKLPEEFQVELRTILEEPDENSHQSVDAFKSFLLQALNNSQSVHNERATYTVDNSSKSAKASTSTESSQSSFLHPESSKSAELKSSDLNDLSFNTIEKMCMKDELPRTPKPMPELTEEQKKALELCRKQELELLSVSPYSSSSKSSERSGSKSCVDSSRKARSLVCSEDPRPVSRSRASSYNWGIRREVLRADLRHSWRDSRSKNDEENKTLNKSYADEFMEKVNNYYEKSDWTKRLSEFEESSVEATPIDRTKSFKASKLSSKSAMGIRKKNCPKRKITTGFIKKRSLIPIYKPDFCKSATMSTAKVSCMLDMICSNSKEESKIPAEGEIVADASPGLFGKSPSSSLTPNGTPRSEKSESKSSGISNSEQLIPPIIITCSSPIIEANNLPSVEVINSPSITIIHSPSIKVIHSPYSSPEPKNYEKRQRRYFCSPGKMPAPKKKRIFFSTPKKENTCSKTSENKIKSSVDVYRKTSETKIKSPVGAYIRGDLSASFISDSNRVHEFLTKKS
ncbi:GSCOCG00002265001-RA-CDS [Cotesia congregata]|nr:GSCOCG00002265001-RA-CDS [Cotesia congregata]